LSIRLQDFGDQALNCLPGRIGTARVTLTVAIVVSGCEGHQTLSELLNEAVCFGVLSSGQR
jgi:hypothetical protein